MPGKGEIYARGRRPAADALDGDPMATTAVLYSGGLDSGVLLAELAASGPVVPVYVDCGLAWQPAERAAASSFAAHLALPTVGEMICLSLPAADLYGDHWSVSGAAVPNAASPDDAVYLPGRNALLAVKPLVWCGLNGVDTLALATLAGNPFADASGAFFRAFSRALSLAMRRQVRMTSPFLHLEKRDVLRRGARLPLEHSFSCIDPQGAAAVAVHCGRCNKCAERRRAFAAADVPDPTRYAC